MPPEQILAVGIDDFCAMNCLSANKGFYIDPTKD
jgi:hypothetical protein